ncbi:MAG: hypothetical protein QOF78_2440 [Phycisphaerales bacterium]|jgi:hypothetical protein|nr:hypothetical protein [Phycisphaerales bacterium]
MGFASGSVSFRRFAVVGDQPEQIDEKLLDKLASHALRAGGGDQVGSPEEIEYGWAGGRHVLDGTFSFENNVYADSLFFALCIDSNKVPGDLRRAYSMMEEDAVAATNPSGFISKMQKRDVKETVRRKLDDDMRSGRFRRSKLLPIVWDLSAATLYCAASGPSLEQLLELFERTFGLTLMPISAGSLAQRILEPRGKRRDYEDFRPTRFVQGPEGETQFPDYPWVSKGPEPKDFLGNEFLLWLWHEAEANGGEIGEASILIDRSLDLDCAYGMTGKDSLRATGPHRMPEARDALRSGKLPRKAGMVLDANGLQFNLTFNPEVFGVGSAKLPDVEEADTPRVVFEERISLMRELCKTLDGLFASFLSVRASSGWESKTSGVRRWILQANNKPVAAVA